jgi:hypothetical protein
MDISLVNRPGDSGVGLNDPSKGVSFGNIEAEKKIFDPLEVRIIWFQEMSKFLDVPPCIDRKHGTRTLVSIKSKYPN